MGEAELDGAFEGLGGDGVASGVEVALPRVEDDAALADVEVFELGIDLGGGVGEEGVGLVL